MPDRSPVPLLGRTQKQRLPTRTPNEGTSLLSQRLRLARASHIALDFGQHHQRLDCLVRRLHILRKSETRAEVPISLAQSPQRQLGSPELTQCLHAFRGGPNLIRQGHGGPVISNRLFSTTKFLKRAPHTIQTNGLIKPIASSLEYANTLAVEFKRL